MHAVYKQMLGLVMFFRNISKNNGNTLSHPPSFKRKSFEMTDFEDFFPIYTSVMFSNNTGNSLFPLHWDKAT